MGILLRAGCALTVGAALAGTPASAATVVRETYTGVVENGYVTILNGPDLRGPSQKYSIQFDSPGEILGGSVWQGLEHHYHWYWADGTYYGGDADQSYHTVLDVSASSPGSFFGRFETPSHPHAEIETDKFGNWTENHYSHWLEMDISFALGSDGTPFSFTLSAVPEPDTWTLMISGLGLMGAIVRRRRVALVDGQMD